MVLKRIVLILFSTCLFFSFAAFAALDPVLYPSNTARVSWDYPTQYVDGTTLPITGIKEADVDYAKCLPDGTFPAQAEGTKTVTPPTNFISIVGFDYSTWCFRVRVTDVRGVDSDNSVTVKKTFVPPKPKPATNVTVASWASVP